MSSLVGHVSFSDLYHGLIHVTDLRRATYAGRLIRYVVFDFFFGSLDVFLETSDEPLLVHLVPGDLHVELSLEVTESCAAVILHLPCGPHLSRPPGLVQLCHQFLDEIVCHFVSFTGCQFVDYSNSFSHCVTAFILLLFIPVNVFLLNLFG